MHWHLHRPVDGRWVEDWRTMAGAWRRIGHALFVLKDNEVGSDYDKVFGDVLYVGLDSCADDGFLS